VIVLKFKVVFVYCGERWSIFYLFFKF